MASGYIPGLPVDIGPSSNGFELPLIVGYFMFLSPECGRASYLEEFRSSGAAMHSLRTSMNPAMRTEDLTTFIVDDDESIPRSVRCLLRSAWHSQIETFTSAESFLHDEVFDRPCLLTLNLQLPGMGGIDLFCRFRDKGFAIYK